MQHQEYEDIKAWVQHSTIPTNLPSGGFSNFKRKAKRFDVVDDRLHCDSKPVLLASDLESVWESYHCLMGHDGINKTVKAVSQKFYMKGTRRWIQDRIKKCKVPKKVKV